MKKTAKNLSHSAGASVPSMAIRKKGDPGRIAMNARRFVTIGLLVLLLLATVSIPAALAHPMLSGGPAVAVSNSGDDDYDPAAGGTSPAGGAGPNRHPASGSDAG